MNYENIPEEYQNDVNSLKYLHQSVETMARQAIEDAKDWDEAKDNIEANMLEIANEAIGVINDFCAFAFNPYKIIEKSENI